MVRQSAKLRPVMTRIPEGLRRRLEKEAKQNGRSMNAEIIARLEGSFRQQEQRELIHATVENGGASGTHSRERSARRRSNAPS